MLSLILVMVCAIAAGWLANRLHVPYPIVLVLAGIGLGSVYVAGLTARAALDPRDRAACRVVPGGFGHLVARFSRKSAADSATRHRAGGNDDPGHKRRVQMARATDSLGSHLCAGRHCLATGCRRGDCGIEAVSPAAPDRNDPGGRKPSERRDRSRALPIRRDSRADRRVFLVEADW